MEKELYTLKDPTMGLEIDGVRYGANQLTKEKVLALINRESAYGQYFHLPEAEKKKVKKIKNKES
jgi:hypothetical protein